MSYFKCGDVVSVKYHPGEEWVVLSIREDVVEIQQNNQKVRDRFSCDEQFLEPIRPTHQEKLAAILGEGYAY